MEIKGIKEAVVKFIKDEEGLTIVEYAVAGGLITLGAVAAFITLGENVDTQITCLGNAVLGNDC
ncbi:Flp family type IVb pilin [Pseudomonas stutzeri]|nr:Flp family type IVb pilin [Stutzerimonas stutzeri]